MRDLLLKMRELSLIMTELPLVMTELHLVMSFIPGLQLKMWNIVMTVKANGKLRFIVTAFIMPFSSPRI